MNILAIETATPRLSVSLITDNTEHYSGERFTDSRSSHCELINGFIGELTTEAGIQLESIDTIAVSTGPGSFTGLRIGIASAMGLAYALDIPVCPVQTLLGLSWNAAPSGMLVCPVIDAKRREAYAAVYHITQHNTIPEQIIAPSAFPVAKLAETIASLDEPLTLTGPAASLFGPSLAEHLGKESVNIPEDNIQPSAQSIAEIGKLMFSAGQAVSPAALTPLYLRRSDAEILRDQKHCQT